MRVACVQFAPVLGEPTVNRDRMRGMCPTGVDVVVFPEMATSGYLFESRDSLRKAAEASDGPTCRAMTESARRLDCHLVYGFPECDGERLYNSAAVVGPEGLVCVYRKVHLFANEPALFDPGEAPWPVLDLRGVKMGLMICFDWFFPESVRCMALNGAELIVHPSNLVLPHCQEAMKTRSLENRVFTATCNRVGAESVGGAAYSYTGRSQVVDPSGTRLVQASEYGEEVIVATLDPVLARDKQAGPGVALFERRRPELYGRITEKPS